MCRCVTSCRWTDVSLICFKGGIRVWNVDAAGSSITCSKTGVTTTVCLLLCVAVFVQWEHLVARKHLRMFSMLSITLSVASRTATYIFPKTATAGHKESSLCVCVAVGLHGGLDAGRKWKRSVQILISAVKAGGFHKTNRGRREQRDECGGWEERLMPSKSTSSRS